MCSGDLRTVFDVRFEPQHGNRHVPIWCGAAACVASLLSWDNAELTIVGEGPETDLTGATKTRSRCWGGIGARGENATPLHFRGGVTATAKLLHPFSLAEHFY